MEYTALVILPHDPTQFESYLSGYKCTYAKVEGTDSRKLKILIATEEEVGGFRHRHKGIVQYMSDDMRKRYDDIVPSIFRRYKPGNSSRSSGLLSAMFAGLVSNTLISSSDRTVYLVKDLSADDATSLSLKPGIALSQTITDEMVGTWQLFLGMNKDELSKTMQDMERFYKEYRQLDEEISLWWDERCSRK